MKNSEQLLYYELIDLLKSPEVFKSITGSNVDTIKMKDSFKQQKENEKKRPKQTNRSVQIQPFLQRKRTWR